VGPFDGPYDDLKAAVVDVWAAACVDELEDYTTKGIRYPMQVYAPLSELGARGCRNVESWPCPVRRDCPVMIFCVETRPRKGGDGLVFGGPKQVGTAISL
jgi:hypothetical protein